MNAQHTPNAKAAERTLEQRERILCAAQKCFVEHGFHAAGMALIAETAGMSPGLIYRYFPSKSAIILAIVERQLEENRASIRALHGASDLAEGAFETYEHWRTGNPAKMNAALFLEMSAQVTRDAALASALLASDQALRSELSSWLGAGFEEGGKGLPAELATLRAFSMQCFMEGLAIRALREPEIAPELVKAAIADFLKGLFGPPHAD